ncbi:MAG: hypothetical protein KGM18_09110 [Sphingomonadales bacterium]|nr:hypothetical protein [Sphingomonadales bacterium]
MSEPKPFEFPEVAQWRINVMRLIFLLMATIMGSMVWYRLIYEYAGWPVDRGLAKSMLGALALMALLGVRYPLQMLPLMLYETVWKTVWIVMIALRSWLAGQWTADIESLFFDCIGIIVAYIVMPWRYVWARYFAQPMEPLIRKT